VAPLKIILPSRCSSKKSYFLKICTKGGKAFGLEKDVVVEQIPLVYQPLQELFKKEYQNNYWLSLKINIL
jgi:hypothetical protein